MNLQCEKAVEKIWWFGYNKEKSIEAGKEKSVYRNITEDIWKSFKDSNFIWILCKGRL